MISWSELNRHRDVLDRDTLPDTMVRSKLRSVLKGLMLMLVWWMVVEEVVY